jgi:hypothetical protein
MCAGCGSENNGLLTTRPKGSMHHFSNWSCLHCNPSSGLGLWWCGYPRGILLICAVIALQRDFELVD